MEDNPHGSLHGIGFADCSLHTLHSGLYKRMQESFIDSDIVGFHTHRELIRQNTQLHKALLKLNQQFSTYRAQTVLSLFCIGNGNLMCAKSPEDARNWLVENWNSLALIGQMLIYKYVGGNGNITHADCSDVPEVLTDDELVLISKKVNRLCLWALGVFYPEALEVVKEERQKEVDGAFVRVEENKKNRGNNK